MRVCLNGEMMDETQAHIAPADRGLLLGDGVFETIAIRGGQAKRVAAHLERLIHDAGVIGLSLPWPVESLVTWVEKIAASNDLTDAIVRLTVTRGSAPRGLLPPESPQPTLLITAAAMPEAAEAARVVISKTTRRNEHSPLARIKCLNYLDNILARQEAAAQNADDAIMLNTQGRVADGTVANVFALIGGEIVTPPVNEGSLPGIMRADVLKLARGDERPVTVEMLKGASEVFFSNALGIRSVIAIDGEPVGDGEPGLITQLLAARL